MTKRDALETNNFLVQTIYLCAFALDILIYESEKMFKFCNQDSSWKREKKQLFNRYLDYIKKACLVNEQIMQDIYDIEAHNNYKNLEVWREEANEMARTILLMSDRQYDGELIQKIHSFIREQESAGYCTEELLSRFYLKKNKDIKDE